MIKRENPIGKTKVNRFFLEKYEKCEKIHKKRVLASYIFLELKLVKLKDRV